MKQSVKAALLSALVLPGLGHVMLKKYRRGVLLMLVALAAASDYLALTMQSALILVDRITGGEIPLDEAAISSLVSDPVSGTGGVLLPLSALVFIACWLIGIIDAYRLGRVEEKRIPPAS